MVRRLSREESFRLTGFVLAEYPTQEKGDREFAVLAEEKMGFPVKEHTIKGIRAGFKLVAHKQKANSHAVAELTAIVLRMQVELQGLETTVATIRRELLECRQRKVG